MNSELITKNDPKSPISEIFRALRTNIQFRNGIKNLKTLLVTSTMQSEGKSLVTANLAVAFAQANKRVIVVDADMRKGRQYNLFDVKPIPGLSNYLTDEYNLGEVEEVTLDKCVQRTEIENLCVIPAGNVPRNPSELLVSDKMEELIKKLEKICDLVIFDGTPSALVTDSIILSRLVDTTIIVVAHKETKTENIKKIKEEIEFVGGNVSGVVLNKIPMSAKKYQKNYYYGYSSLKVQKGKRGRDEYHY